ncbi:MAG: hypothetical protein IPP14_05755 [Planctomycetes bacterium]|nr:hypothetical protein [Planctomycetota bacterium]
MQPSSKTHHVFDPDHQVRRTSTLARFAPTNSGHVQFPAPAGFREAHAGLEYVSAHGPVGVCAIWVRVLYRLKSDNLYVGALFAVAKPTDDPADPGELPDWRLIKINDESLHGRGAFSNALFRLAGSRFRGGSVPFEAFSCGFENAPVAELVDQLGRLDHVSSDVIAFANGLLVGGNFRAA